MAHRPLLLISHCSSLTDESAGDKQPDPPLTFSFAGDNWVMHSSASVRQSVETLSLRAGPSAGGTMRSMKVVSESVLDLESIQKSVHCEVSVADLEIRNCHLNSVPEACLR